MFAAASVTLFAVITLGPALCYPTGWDELVYHSVLPERWLTTGWPAFYSDLPYSGFPSLGEIVFWLMAPLDSVIAPRLLVWVCWILGLACLFRLLDLWLKGTTAIVIVMAFALNDTLLLISANCYVESILLLDVTALLLALSRPVDRENASKIQRSDSTRLLATFARPSLPGIPRDARFHVLASIAKDRKTNLAAICGILAGGAAAVKLTGCAVLAVPVIWCIVQVAFKRFRWHELVRPSLGYALVAASFSFPFYLRTWLATGNPFYPYFCEWFSSDPARLDMSHHHHVIGGLWFGMRSVASFIEAPLLLAFRSENYDGGFGWQLLLFLLLAIVAMVSAIRWRTRRRIVGPLVVALWFYVAWFFSAQQARFAVSAFVAFVMLAAVGLRIVPRKWRQIILLALVAASVVSVPWWRVDYYRASWLTVFGQLTRTDYVHNVTDRIYLPMVQAVHTITRSDAKLMLLYEHRGFYLARQHVIGTPRFQEGPFTPPEHFESPESVMQILKQNQITHVLLAKVNPSPDLEPGWIDRDRPFLRALESCLQQRRLIPRWESEIYLLLEVADEA